MFSVMVVGVKSLRGTEAAPISVRVCNLVICNAHVTIINWIQDGEHFTFCIKTDKTLSVRIFNCRGKKHNKSNHPLLCFNRRLLQAHFAQDECHRAGETFYKLFFICTSEEKLFVKAQGLPNFSKSRR